MKLKVFLLLLLLTPLASAYNVRYTGSHELCILHYNGTETCLLNGQDITIRDNSYCRLNLEYVEHTTDNMAFDIITFLELVVMVLLVGVVLLGALWMMVRFVF